MILLFSIIFIVGVVVGLLIGRHNPIYAAKTEVELDAAYEAAKRKLGLKP